MIYIGAGPPPPPETTSPNFVKGDQLSPLSGKAYSRGDDDYGDETEQERRKRLSSGKFKQDGGVLGRLGFEAGSSEAKGKVQPQAVQPIGVESQEARQSDPDFLLTDPASAIQTDSTRTPAVEAEGRRSEELEILDSAEKKNKFWKPKARARRLSKARSDYEGDTRVGD